MALLPVEELFLDQQSLGLRPFLEGKGVIVRDTTEILGHKDTGQGVADDKIIRFLLKNPALILIIKDRGLGRRATEQKSDLRRRIRGGCQRSATSLSLGPTERKDYSSVMNAV